MITYSSIIFFFTVGYSGGGIRAARIQGSEIWTGLHLVSEESYCMIHIHIINQKVSESFKALIVSLSVSVYLL